MQRIETTNHANWLGFYNVNTPHHFLGTFLGSHIYFSSHFLGHFLGCFLGNGTDLFGYLLGRRTNLFGCLFGQLDWPFWASFWAHRLTFLGTFLGNNCVLVLCISIVYQYCVLVLCISIVTFVNTPVCIQTGTFSTLNLVELKNQNVY